MLTHTACATPLTHKPDIARPLRGKRPDESSSLGALGIAMSFGHNTEIYAEGEQAAGIYSI